MPRVTPVNAVVRFDSEQVDPRFMFTVKEVLPTAEEALSEVERLNERTAIRVPPTSPSTPGSIRKADRALRLHAE